MKSLISSFILFLTSSFLAVVLFIANFFHAIWNILRYPSKIRRATFYFLNSALSIDIMGNTLFKPMLNDLFLKKNSYSFGTDRDETISSALGKNQCINGLTWLGVGLASILDLIDSGHCYKSINDNTYYDIYAPPKTIPRIQTLTTLILFLIGLYSLTKLLIFIL